MVEKGFDLVDITHHCEFKLGRSGWCNGFNEIEQEIYHIQVHYRGDCICNVLANDIEVIDEKLHCVFKDPRDGNFIIYRKVKL